MKNSKEATREGVLYSSSAFYNPLFANGKQIECIQFYDKSGTKLITFDRKTSVKWFGSNSDHKTIVLGSEIKNRNKLKFDRAEHFMYGHILYLNINLLTSFNIETQNWSDLMYEKSQQSISFDVLTSGSDINGPLSMCTVKATNWIDSTDTKLCTELREMSEKYDTKSIYMLKNMYMDGILKVKGVKSYKSICK